MIEHFPMFCPACTWRGNSTECASGDRCPRCDAQAQWNPAPPGSFFPSATFTAEQEQRRQALEVLDTIDTSRPDTPLELCLRLVGARPGHEADMLLWEQRLNAYQIPCAPGVRADDWTDMVLRCVRCYGVEVAAPRGPWAGTMTDTNTIAHATGLTG